MSARRAAGRPKGGSRPVVSIAQIVLKIHIHKNTDHVFLYIYRTDSWPYLSVIINQQDKVSLWKLVIFCTYTDRNFWLHRLLSVIIIQQDKVTLALQSNLYYTPQPYFAIVPISLFTVTVTKVSIFLHRYGDLSYGTLKFAVFNKRNIQELILLAAQ